MAFFKFRKASGEQSAPAPVPESVETMRKRARYRLAGAALLVLAGVVGFPVLFDNQPRPISIDIPIDIPDKTKLAPLSGAGGSAVPADAASVRSSAGEVAAALKAASSPATDSENEEVIIASSKASAGPEATTAQKRKPEPVTQTSTAEKTTEKVTDKAGDSAAVGRFVVQFGAFAESKYAQEARMKVERAGMKTYAQIAQSSAGKTIRVRVGPFGKRSDAEKAAEKIKKIGLPASILEL